MGPTITVDLYVDTDALADAAVQDWFGFELLDAPKRLKTHVFEI